MAPRTWVSGVGDDANPGSRTAPCKTFAGALSKTNPGGEIDAIDPGGYGAVTINKALTIDGGTGSGWASILASGTAGIVINATGANDVVTLRNLSINGNRSGIVGIRIVAAATVCIENCVIFNFRSPTGGIAGRGISDNRVAGGKLIITDTTVRNNAQGGIVIAPASGSARIFASLDNVRLVDNGNVGLGALAGVLVTISNSLVTGGPATGILVDQPVPPAAGGITEANVENCVISHNGVGVRTNLGGAVARLSNTTVVGNGTGIAVLSGAVFSYRNNRIAANGGGNVPSGGFTIALQ